ncbi:MAG: hypothetical protein H7321_09335 [Bacteroidia bacterium]|nr:hypothetical protein [Bacteroidia bacterium]
MIRLSYDTSLKHLIRLGLCDAVPIVLFKTIPSSNLHRWRNEQADKYSGCELNEIASEKMEMLQQFAKHQKAQAIFVSYLRLISAFRRIAKESAEIKKMLFSYREQVCDAVQRVSGSMDLKKAGRFFGISSSTLYNWMLEAKVKCSFSYFQFCSIKRPNQLTKTEVLTIKSLLEDERFKHWPVSSIAHYAANNNLVNAGLNTFY